MFLSFLFFFCFVCAHQIGFGIDKNRKLKPRFAASIGFCLFTSSQTHSRCVFVMPSAKKPCLSQLDYASSISLSCAFWNMVEAGIAFWKDHLISFFHGDSPLFWIMKSHLMRHRMLKGRITMW